MFFGNICVRIQLLFYINIIIVGEEKLPAGSNRANYYEDTHNNADDDDESTRCPAGRNKGHFMIFHLHTPNRQFAEKTIKNEAHNIAHYVVYAIRNYVCTG